MKKITSFLMMMVLCCIGAYAQAATEFVNKLIKIGAPQTEIVPGKWYFVHTPRNPNASTGSGDYADSNDGVIQSKGGLVYDNTSAVMVSATSVIGELTDLVGANSNNYMKHMLRFVAVEGETDVYYIQFGTGNWMADAPNKATVTNVQYQAGLAGKYNFYLPTVNGTPNTIGRFAWNKYDMAGRVDNNGAGGTVVFWESGESTGYADESSIAGNKIWEVFEVEVVGEVDLYVEAYSALTAYHNSKENEGNGQFVENLRNNKDGIVGTDRGDYREEGVNAFLAYFDKIAELIMNVDMFEGDPYEEYLKPLYPEVADLEALLEGYEEAYNNMLQDKVSRALDDIVPGYYTITNAKAFSVTKNDTVFYTQEEADEANAELGLFEGDEGSIAAGDVKDVTSTQVPAPMKSLYAEDSESNDGTKGRWMAWSSRKKNARFLWKIEAVEGKPTEYRLINMYKGESFKGVSLNSANAFLTVNDTTTACFDWRADKQFVTYTDDNGEVVEDSVRVFNIRGSQHNEDGGNYLHPNAHNSTSENWIIGYYDELPSRWFLTPVSDEEANDWMFGPEAQLRAMILKGDSIVAAAPPQIEIAKDIALTDVFEEDSVVVTANQFYSQYTTEDAQTIPEGQTVYDFMLDGKQSTYWHSKWENGNQPFKKHYLQVNATEALEGWYVVKLQRRPVSGDHITELIVKGYVDAPTDETPFEEGTELGTLKLPLSAKNETIVTNPFDATGMNYLRFYSNATAAAENGGGANRGYWHASAFNVFKAEANPRYETTQYVARKAEADALAAAIDVWNKGKFSAENIELYEDEAFNAAYNDLVDAAEAWAKVYVDPTALREAIAAAPAENLFVIGNNPGQWKEGVVTPAGAAAAAEAYNASGAYTTAESEAHIAAIAKAEEDVWAAANKIETGKWYRFSFPTEEMYDEFEWDKAGAQKAENETTGDIVSPELFGKVVAAGKQSIEYVPYTTDEGEEDTLKLYSVEEAVEICAGNNLFFFEDAEFENGEDLFQFILATDSTYMIQNKATGLFIHGGYPVYLSAAPSYFDVKAIGAGATLIGSYNIFGGDEEGYNYLHGERSTNLLTTWDSENLASNSMIMIEEVEAVTEEPTTEYTQKLWPGKVYTYTMPVDVKVLEGATAYGAELNVTEEDTTIVLKTIEAETISAGTPFIMIADLEGEYLTTAERLNQIAKDYDNWGLFEKQEANEILDDEFARVYMDHGMKVDTVLHELLDLRGTLKQVTVEAGKALVANENKFKHTILNTNVAAYSAYITCDFDANSEDIISGLIIEIDGTIETGISEVLDKVAKSGNIYNAAGQLVGKGNINTVNNLPAGIYIVNGVKVTKK